MGFPQTNSIIENIHHDPRPFFWGVPRVRQDPIRRHSVAGDLPGLPGMPWRPWPWVIFG